MRNLRSMRGASLGAMAIALALTASACGSSRSGSDDTANGTAETPAASAASFGDLESPCGKGDAKGATAQGVTDTSIAIGYGDDRGFAAAPGLNQEMGDAVKAMIGWCNEQGGINGRQIVGHQYDAAMTNAASVMQKACKNDFMLVGEGFAYDEAAEQFRVGCDLPAVAGFTIGPNSSMGPNKFDAIPRPVDFNNGARVASDMEFIPAIKDSLAGLSSTSPAIQQGLQTALKVAGHVGAKVVDCGVTLSQDGEANYVPFAEKFKKCDAKALWFATSPSPIAFGLLEALQRIDAGKQYAFEATWYSESVAKWNAQSKAADGMVTAMEFQPLENADLVPATQKYIDIVEGAGGKTALLGIQSTSAFLLWATVAKDCGSDLTRECMVAGLKNVHDWTAGGLHAPTDPGNNMPGDCAIVVQLTGGEYKQAFPAKRGEFHCNKDFVVPLDPADSGVKLNADRISTAFLKK